ncbi:hypothetical protein [Massiliimalia massiliensis]|jgi:hypothetical protein|uniref:hypothetical protein n=1 Tax=Massiliimalia massiliensis TaxID=1852384 RepID=UPI000986F376|nr:hypothetical protein [Massiliimalia massiliensis]
MIQQNIRLRSFREIEHFVQAVDSVPYMVEISQEGRQDFTMRASSVIGICSLDLSHPLLLQADTDDHDSVYSAFRDYIV